MKKYQHYPELHYNVLIILCQLSNNIDSKNLVNSNLKKYKLAKKLNIDELRENFSIHRGKIRGFSKLINLMHLNILSNCSQLVRCASEFGTDEQTEDEYYKIIYSIFLDIRAFYRTKKMTRNNCRIFL